MIFILTPNGNIHCFGFCHLLRYIYMCRVFQAHQIINAIFHMVLLEGNYSIQIES